MRFYRALALAGLTVAAAACSDEQPTSAAPELMSAQDLAPLHAAAPDKKVEGSYIVVLKEGANPRSVMAIAGVKPKFEYTPQTLNGFAAELNHGQLNALRNNPNVDYIEEDQIATIDATQNNATWGLDRIDQRNRPLNGTYVYNTTASNVYAYIIDTGVLASHNDFGGRAQQVYNSTGDGRNTDCNGHGTHVAGTVGGTTYGVAKGVRIRGVKVLGCNGSGTNSGIIAGVDWVRNNRVNPAVANMSLGGGFSSATNTAVNNLANSGVFVAVAAGNSNANACNYSPASASAAYTVASSTNTDAKSSFSNFGSCVNIYAPGSSITSAWHTSNTATNTISGTSMASPHVAGVAALIKATYGNISSSQVASYLTNNATTNVITSNPSGTPNRLLFKTNW